MTAELHCCWCLAAIQKDAVFIGLSDDQLWPGVKARQYLCPECAVF